MLSTSNLKQKLVSFAHEQRWALLTGVLTGTSYIPFWPWAALFNFAPLWWYWLHKAKSRRDAFWSGWWSQFILNLIGFHWVFHVSNEFGHIPAPLSLIVLLLFAALAHLYIPLVGILLFEIKKRTLNPNSSQEPIRSNGRFAALLGVLVAMWALAEIYWPYIFQWHMGYTLLWARLPIFHWADVIGFQGLACVLLLFNAFFVWSANKISSVEQTMMVWLKPLAKALLIFAILNVGGWWHGKAWSEKTWDKTVSLRAVQANIGNAEKIMAERGYAYQDFIVQRFIQLTQTALKNDNVSQFIVWPESAIPDYLDNEFSDRPRPQMIRQFLQISQRHLITGAYSREIVPTAEDKIYNALFTINKKGELFTAPYRKKHLLAFGEYTPFATWFPKLNEISPSGKGFERGPGPQNLTLNDASFGQINIAPQICYEALYPEFSRQGALGGAQLLLNLTNDSWFGFHSEPYQHLSMTFARAIENRRPLLRVTNTGFTAAIQASGELLEQSPLYQEWSHVFNLKYDEKPSLTLYTRYGAFLPIVLVMMALVGLGALLKPSND